MTINPGDHVRHVIHYENGAHPKPVIGYVLECREYRGDGYHYHQIDVQWVQHNGNMECRSHTPAELVKVEKAEHDGATQ